MYEDGKVVLARAGDVEVNAYMLRQVSTVDGLVFGHTHLVIATQSCYNDVTSQMEALSWPVSPCAISKMG